MMFGSCGRLSESAPEALIVLIILVCRLWIVPSRFALTNVHNVELAAGVGALQQARLLSGIRFCWFWVSGILFYSH